MIFVKKNGQIKRLDGRYTNEIVVIISEEGVSGIIESKEVPAITSTQLTFAYNSMVAGKVVVVASENGEYFIIKQANSVDNKPTIYFDFEETHILKYALGQSVVITAKEIGSGSGTGAVESVNGKVGVVVLNAGDILAQNAQTIQQNLERIDERIDDATEDIETLQEDLETVRDIAQAKTNSYVVDLLADITGTQDEDGNFTSVTAITGVDLTQLKVGNNVYIIDTEAPDYWVSAITPAIKLNKLQTEKIDIENYYTKDETYSADEVDGLLENKADLDSDDNVLAQGLKDSSGNIITPAGLSGFITIPAPASTTLTDEEYAIFTSGKIVKLSGTYLELVNPTFYPAEINGAVIDYLVIGYDAYSKTRIATARVTVSTKTFSKTYITKGIYITAQGNFGIYDKQIPAYPSNTENKHFAILNGTLTWIDNPQTEIITTSTVSRGLSSNVLYNCTTPLTSLSVASLSVQTGDLQPCWKVHFKVASGFTFSSTPTLVWRDGTPSWSDLVGEEVEILIEASLTSLIYNAWLIK